MHLDLSFAFLFLNFKILQIFAAMVCFWKIRLILFLTQQSFTIYFKTFDNLTYKIFRLQIMPHTPTNDKFQKCVDLTVMNLTCQNFQCEYECFSSLNSIIFLFYRSKIIQSFDINKFEVVKLRCQNLSEIHFKICSSSHI